MFSHMFETPIDLADVDVHSTIVTLVTLSPDFMFPSTLPITVGLITIAKNIYIIVFEYYAIIAYLLIISYLIAIVSYLIILPTRTSCESGTGALRCYDIIRVCHGYTAGQDFPHRTHTCKHCTHNRYRYIPYHNLHSV